MTALVNGQKATIRSKTRAENGGYKYWLVDSQGRTIFYQGQFLYWSESDIKIIN